MADEPLHRVALLGVPVALYLRTSEHLDDLLREFDLIRQTEDASPDSVPHRLHELVTNIMDGAQEFTRQPMSQLQEAAARSQEAINIAFVVPAEAAESCRSLDQMLDEADDYCRSGRHLLTLAAPPEALRYRRWLTGQFIAQIAGEPPTSWPEHEARRAGRPTSDLPD